MQQSDTKGQLYQIFLDPSRRTRQVHKWHHYFDAYERHFGGFRGRPLRMLEIGVYKGGSLEMWRKYLGPEAQIIGLDIDPACEAYVTDGTRVFIGDQADPAFLRRILVEVGTPDLVLDDGGHTANQQIVSFETIYPTMPEHGIYMVEDTHTAFWGGAFADRYDGQSFLDFAFSRCRSLQEWTMRQNAFDRYGTPPDQRVGHPTPVSEFCRTTKSISFHDSIVVFERGPRAEPWHEVR
jgi:hypothetical protein